MPSTKKRKRPITRSWVDLCSNDVTLDGFTIKERVTVSHSLGYSISTISKYFTLENMTRKDMCVDCDSPELVSLLFWLFTIVILSLLACRCDIPDLACSLDDYQRSGSTVNTNKATTKGLEKTHGSNRHLSRVTIQFSSVDNVHARLTELSHVLNSYDIRAVCPTSEKAFQYACATMDVDIISLGKDAMCRRFSFPCRHDVIQKAVDRGVVFEIPYSCFLTDVSSRRQQFLSNACALVQGTGGTGIICSSMASMGFEMRKPYDVANMATFFGLSDEQAYDCVSKIPLKVIERATRRLAYRETMAVKKIPKSVDSAK